MSRNPPIGAAAAWLAMLAVVLAGCDGGAGGEPPAGATRPASAGEPRQTPYHIVATTGMVADIVRQVAGEHATVQGLIGEGVDPHLYRVTRNDIVAMDQADVIFYSGLMLEGKMADTLVRMGRRGKPVFAVTELIDESYLLEPEGMQGHFDPHVWMDVAAWMKAVEAVAESLSEAMVDPAHADDYRRHAERYNAQLAELDDYARRSIASIPRRSRVLITAHDAFNYFGRAYGLEVRGIQGVSTESEAGLHEINRLVDLIVERDVKAVFPESSVPPKNVEALVRGAASRGKTVRVGQTIFSDAMGPPGTYEGTYVGMIDHNVTVITRALGGEAPARGMQGKLAPPADAAAREDGP